MGTPSFQAGYVTGQLLVWVGIPLALLGALWALRALWRASRRVSVNTAARTAGALTAAAQQRIAGAAQAFRDGRGDRSRPS